VTATLQTRLTKALGIQVPIISAGMGGPARSALAAAVSAAGGFGLLGMVREPPALIEAEIAAVRVRTSRPFGVNLIPFATDPKLLQDELAVCFDARVPAMCFFWQVFPDIIAQAKKAGSLVLYQVGSLEDALLAESAGADVVIVQGVEAGGHVKGTLPLAVLLPQVAGKVKIPVVASGGMATGRSIAAALALGADGVHCGTVFLASEESFAHPFHKERIVEAKPGDTIHTDLFAINWPPNSPVRVLRNSVSDAAAGRLLGNHPDRLPREVIGYEGERPIYKFSTDSPLQSMSGDFEKMGLFAGESAGFVDKILPAAQIVEQMMDEAVRTIGWLHQATL
jgi:nitronate monooxygenase